MGYAAPNIILAGQQPQFNSPVDSLSKILQMRDIQSQVQLRQQQAEDVAQQAALRQRQVNDVNTVQGMLADSAHPEYAAAFAKGDTSFLNGRISPETEIALAKAQNERINTQIATDKGTLENKQALWTAAGHTIAGIQALPEEERAAAAAQALGQLKQLPGASSLNLPSAIQDTSDAGLEKLAALTNAEKSFHDEVLSRKQEAEKLALTQAQEAEAQGKGQQATAEAAIKKNQLEHVTPGGLLPMEEVQRQEAAAKLAQAQAQMKETQRHNLSEESTARLNAAVSQGRLAQEQMINGMKYGPGTVDYWVQQLQQNPDSVKELPAEMRSVVGQRFNAITGLPLPTQASQTAQQSEMGARNAIDNAEFIRNALKNPEIRANIGPIMGRLGNVEQAIGTAPQLSPQAEALAQELRTRMRYFVFQEGKAILGGRLPQNLMHELESNSANPKMDPDMITGALNGAEGSARSVIDNVDAQRFGGQVRPDSMRHLPQGTPKSTVAPKEDLTKVPTDELLRRLTKQQ